MADTFPPCISYYGIQVLIELLLLQETSLVSLAQDTTFPWSPLAPMLITDEKHVWSLVKSEVLMRKDRRIGHRSGRNDVVQEPSVRRSLGRNHSTSYRKRREST